METTRISYKVNDVNALPSKKTGTNDCLPLITVNQANREVIIEAQETSGYQKNAIVKTELTCELAVDGQSLYVRGDVSVRNFQDWKRSGSQRFVFAIFVGDTNCIYVHRAPATKGWWEAKPENITKRLRKLGIGASKVAYQQGDFLLKKVEIAFDLQPKFYHETMGSGHHKFTAPVLYLDTPKGRIYWVKDEPATLIHFATDGLKHPTQYVAIGFYQVGTTASQLLHRNARD